MTECRGYTYRNTFPTHLFLKPLFMGHLLYHRPCTLKCITLTLAGPLPVWPIYTYLSQVFPKERPALPKPSLCLPVYFLSSSPTEPMEGKVWMLTSTSHAASHYSALLHYSFNETSVPKSWHSDLRTFSFVCRLTAALNNPDSLLIFFFFLIWSLTL